MKKALVSYQGFVGKVVDPGEETEHYQGPDMTFTFVDAPDNIQMDWTLEWSPSQQIMVWVERDGPFTDNSVARSVAYGTVGQQLDMLYHDIAQNGTIDQNSAWFQHVSNVKSLIDKPVYTDPISIEDHIAASADQEPSPDRPCVPSTIDMPAWKRYPGWSGYGS